MVLRSGTDRDGASGSGGNNNHHGNDAPLPDPPIHPTLADVLTQQTRLMVHIVNQMANVGNQGLSAEPQVNRFGDIFYTDPLDADFWLNVIEEKLGLIEC